jgi:hypothetical protein
MIGLMNEAFKLRIRVLSALGAGLMLTAFVPVGCVGSVENEPTPPQQKQEMTPSCAGAQVQCSPPGTTHFNVGESPVPVQTPDPIFDSNGCQVTEQVRDGCCNPPKTGPELIDGKCCYGFCAGDCCGRPMLVEGAPRLAAVVERSDWAAELAGSAAIAELDSELRAAIGQEWLSDAQLEHASIASFARFTLDLLAFAAPAALIEDAQQAISDEIRHARDCFALASLYQGAPCGPGPLRMDGVRASSSLLEAAVAAVREGCVGETVAALTAKAQANTAEISEIRAILERIAADEARHAELAWRFVRWAMQEGGPSVRAAVAAAFAEVHGSSRRRQPPEARDALLNAHGRLSKAGALEMQQTAIREVIEPCAQALLMQFNESSQPAS